MKRLVVGILAHVDAGKTTLSEGLLVESGVIRKAGRVDNKDTFLDTYSLEKERGITIFSKQAVLNLDDTVITLLDTPGHVDFSAEMERTLQVLDYAILVISGADGVQGHTKTLWKLLEKYNIPVFIFINKMDQKGTDKEYLLEDLKKQLADNCVDFSEKVEIYKKSGIFENIINNENDKKVILNKSELENFYDSMAMCSEALMEEYLETGFISDDNISEAINNRELFPCFFGSALKMEGVKEFLSEIIFYSREKTYSDEFSARVYKIGRDEQDNRLTYMKILGGSLKARDIIGEEKVNQIRVYSGAKYEAIPEAVPGMVCAVTGLTDTYPGQGLGMETDVKEMVLEPVLSYKINLPNGCDPAVFLPKIRMIEEEEPTLHIVWNEKLKEVQAQLMGEVQTEILANMVKERFGLEISFGEGDIVYKETIANTVEGVGHFEPLRHYAEAHILMEPGERGTGIIIDTDCSEDILDKNWQRLIMTHLAEREHIGVLTGSPLTDVKLTIVTGRAHQKHTEGGDFRQATYRAVRHGLMQADNVLLEPYYNFTLTIPSNMVGRAMTDFEMLGAVSEGPVLEGDMAVLAGKAPVISMRNYQKEVTAYTKGSGKLYLEAGGYEVCHNTEEVMERIGYLPERDTDNPASSVFCAHGAGFVVEWDEVCNYMHLESVLEARNKKSVKNNQDEAAYVSVLDEWIDTDEIDSIIEKTFFANSHDKDSVKKWKTKRKREDYIGPVERTYKPKEKLEKYMLVDGYNIIFAWQELNELAKDNVDGARGALLDILCNYQAIVKVNLIVVFDAYRVKGHNTEIFDYHNIHVVYTKEAETADQYIEKFAHENGKKYDITVATSDGLEQIIIRGQGCRLISSREFEEEVKNAGERITRQYQADNRMEKNYLADSMPEEVYQALKNQE